MKMFRRITLGGTQHGLKGLGLTVFDLLPKMQFKVYTQLENRPRMAKFYMKNTYITTKAFKYV